MTKAIELPHEARAPGGLGAGGSRDVDPIAHEHLITFVRKPAKGENLRNYKYSVKWR
jgi:hypothetical protein